MAEQSEDEASDGEERLCREVEVEAELWLERHLGPGWRNTNRAWLLFAPPPRQGNRRAVRFAQLLRHLVGLFPRESRITVRACAAATALGPSSGCPAPVSLRLRQLARSYPRRDAVELVLAFGLGYSRGGGSDPTGGPRLGGDRNGQGGDRNGQGRPSGGRGWDGHWPSAIAVFQLYWFRPAVKACVRSDLERTFGLPIDLPDGPATVAAWGDSLSYQYIYGYCQHVDGCDNPRHRLQGWEPEVVSLHGHVRQAVRGAQVAQLAGGWFQSGMLWPFTRDDSGLRLRDVAGWRCQAGHVSESDPCPICPNAAPRRVDVDKRVALESRMVIPGLTHRPHTFWECSAKGCGNYFGSVPDRLHRGLPPVTCPICGAVYEIGDPRRRPRRRTLWVRIWAPEEQDPDHGRPLN